MKPEDRVAEEHVNGRYVSTVKLICDHSFGGGPPLWYETMVFPSDGEKVTSWSEVYSDRYTTKEEAAEGHKRAVEWARTAPAGVTQWESANDPA